MTPNRCVLRLESAGDCLRCASLRSAPLARRTAQQLPTRVTAPDRSRGPPRRELTTVTDVILVVAALKGGVGKTTTAVYLAAIAAAARHPVTLIDAAPQASTAEWIEASPDERLKEVEVVEAPSDRLLTRAMDRVDGDEVAIIDSAPGQEQRLTKALERANVAVMPIRVGGVETSAAEAVL